ncbi:3-oxoacyl-[acyl-carrier-protein] synthase 3 [Fundidesulfovibrio magnetotacticus]|uniref:Beta-ketoacyl-[acyl-carrier-protein] synthase III n=1 Tax=Fundidesulfovibrio magnetotacticus TaxID=2730080 RepID=A0A6V8LZG3_9BACT|nr:beta-ketoacyl-ACP synthase III [Fundidesulfovibrio magnetotacticus]GFK95618.1 3-oxoacyl-[acyl-carrier-protein] synthase 3 [Fundidesulfovibrio magnetotacticus]
MQPRFTLEGFGRYVPQRVLTNADLESIVETSDDWITTRTGIKERRIVAPGEACTDLAAHAARAALDNAGRAAGELSHIYVATFTPDTVCPPAACTLQDKLGLKNLACMDIAAACSGFLFALDTAMGAVARKPDSVVLVCASEVVTSRTNWADRATCVLFGDGAGAVVLSNREPKPGQASVRDIIIQSDGALGPLLTVKGGGSAHPYKLGQTVDADHFIEMIGPEIYKNAVRNMTQVCEDILARNALTMNDVDLFIPHQANLRIMEGVAKRLRCPEAKVMITVDRYGNTAAASAPIALADALAEGRVGPGSRVLMTTFGGGFTWAAALLEFA